MDRLYVILDDGAYRNIILGVLPFYTTDRTFACASPFTSVVCCPLLVCQLLLPPDVKIGILGTWRLPIPVQEKLPGNSFYVQG